MIHDLDELVGSAVTKLLGMQMRPVPVSAGFAEGEPHVAGVVGIVGKLNGIVYVFTTQKFAQRITSILLGLDLSEVTPGEMVNDAMGEVANMLVGQMKSRLTDRGIPCVLTIPSVVRGSNFSVEAITTTEGHIFSYEAEENRIFIQFLLQPMDQTKQNSIRQPC
jgi:chemotaxis protein CheX